MLRLYPVKEYKIAESVWEVRGADDGSSQKVVEEWWDEWKGPIANLALKKHQGKVGVGGVDGVADGDEGEGEEGRVGG